MAFSSVSKISLAILGSGIGLSCLAMDSVALAATSSIGSDAIATSEAVSEAAGDSMEVAQINIQIGGSDDSDVSEDADVSDESIEETVVTEEGVEETSVVQPAQPIEDNVVSTPQLSSPQNTVSQGPIQVTAPEPSINVGPAQITIPGLPGTAPEPAVQPPQTTVPQPTVPQSTAPQVQPTVPRPSIPSTTTQPSLPQPTIPNPTVVSPRPSQPTTQSPVQPTVSQPSQPTIAQPTTPQPNVAQPGVQYPYGVQAPSAPQATGYPAYPQYPGYPQSAPQGVPQGLPQAVPQQVPQNVGGINPGYPYGVAAPSNTQVISPQPTVINLGGPQVTTPSTLPAAAPTPTDGAVQLVCSAPGYRSAGYPAGYGVPAGVPYGVPAGYGAPGYPTAPAPGTVVPGAALPETQLIGNTSTTDSSSDLSGWAASLLAIANPQVGVDLGGVEVDVPIPVGAIAGSLLGNSGSQDAATTPGTVVAQTSQPGYGYPAYPQYPTAPATYPGYPAYPQYPTAPVAGYPAYPTSGMPTPTPGTTQVITSHPTVINVGGAGQTPANTTTIPAATPHSSTTANGGVQMICNPGAAAPASYPAPQAVAQPPQPVAQDAEAEQSGGGGFLGGIRPSVGVDVGPFNVGIPLPF